MTTALPFPHHHNAHIWRRSPALDRTVTLAGAWSTWSQLAFTKKPPLLRSPVKCAGCDLFHIPNSSTVATDALSTVGKPSAVLASSGSNHEWRSSAVTACEAAKAKIAVATAHDTKSCSHAFDEDRDCLIFDGYGHQMIGQADTLWDSKFYQKLSLKKNYHSRLSDVVWYMYTSGLRHSGWIRDLRDGFMSPADAQAS